MKMKSAEDDGMLTSAVNPLLRLSLDENEKENFPFHPQQQKRCLVLRSF